MGGAGGEFEGVGVHGVDVRGCGCGFVIEMSGFFSSHWLYRTVPKVLGFAAGQPRPALSVSNERPSALTLDKPFCYTRVSCSDSLGDVDLD